MRHVIFGLAVLVAIGTCGCSKSSSSPTATTNAASAGAQPVAPAAKPVAVPANATPDQVVTVFLQALRSGDSPTTESLLTARARQELGKHQMHVDVQASPNAVYQVERAIQLPNEPTVAHVNSLWTEKYVNEQGQPVEEKYGIVWGLRHQAEGWRVAGMQVELVPGVKPYLDFENPEDMMKKRDEALAAMQSPAAAPEVQPLGGQVPPIAAQTAQQPQFPPPQQVPARIER